MDISIIEDYSKFSKIPVPEIIRRISIFRELNAKDWNAIPQKSYAGKAEIFYKNSKNYIFDLLSVGYSKKAVAQHLNSINPMILSQVNSHSGKKFLDFGGGLGLTCEIAYDMGKEPTYLDIPGQVSDFAQWRFRKYDLPVKIIYSSPNSLVLEDNFDIIFTNAVFEHLIDPEGVISVLCNHVNFGGLLILLIDLSGHTEAMPMHRDIDIHKLHSIVTKNNFINVFGVGQFCSVWHKIDTF